MCKSIRAEAGLRGRQPHKPKVWGSNSSGAWGFFNLKNLLQTTNWQ